MCHRGVWRRYPQLARKNFIHSHRRGVDTSKILYEISKNVQKYTTLLLYCEILLESLGILEDSPGISESVQGIWDFKPLGHRWILENLTHWKQSSPQLKCFD